MSEMPMISGERPDKDLNADNLNTLTELSDSFDPEKARSLVEQDKPQIGEEPAATLPEKEEVLNPKDAANEYLLLLDDLSKDFSNPDYHNEEKIGADHYPANITTDIGLKYSDNPHYRWHGYASTEAGMYDKTMLRIAAADSILAGEIGWRKNSEKAGEYEKEFNEKMSSLDAKYQKKGPIGKLLGKRRYEKKKMNLKAENTVNSWDTNRGYNSLIARELAYVYNENGSDMYSQENYEIENEARNRKFFGLDDPERAKKVERAIELRIKYESEWTKKQ